ncbi:MAG: ketoacyl-ACP synthase III [Planctomycetota bacterium]
MGPRVRIIGLGIHVPEPVLTNEELERGMPWLHTSAAWIREHTGILERHVAPREHHAADLGYLAAEEALRLAAVAPEEVDLLLLATNTSQFVYPAGAARIQARFGTDDRGDLRMRKAGALDLQQGCSSFVGAIGLARGLIAAGQFRTVLCVGADVATRMVDWSDRDAILLGDAAAACVLTGDEGRGGFEYPAFEVLGQFMRTDPVMADAIRQPGVLNVANDPFSFIGRDFTGEGAELRRQLYGSGFQPDLANGRAPFFQMDGRKVYRFVKRIVPRQGYLEVLRSSGLLGDAPAALGLDAVESLEDVGDRERRQEIAAWLATKVDLFVPHSANLSLNQELAEEMGIPYERMYVTLHKYANTSAASVGLSLYEALRQPSRYDTLTKRDGKGEVKVESRAIVTPALERGQVALLLSFGAGNSWNYVVTRRL